MSNKKEENQDKQQGNQINIELSEEIAEGVYANLAMIAHSNSEFVIDFIRLMPGVPKAKVKSRVVVSLLSMQKGCLLHYRTISTSTNKRLDQ